MARVYLNLRISKHLLGFKALLMYTILVCGIVGGIGRELRPHIQSKLKLLERRGPDNSSVLTFKNNLTLGSTRLSMTDPHPRSNQPMIDLRTNNALVFNGEIYNFLDLKNQLHKNGIEFSTQSDTEVILKSLSYFGSGFINKFEGMYSLAFYNTKNNSLLLARDFLGKKPLYYSICKDFFIFASQINIIKEYLKKMTLDNVSLTNYLKLGYVINPDTMYKEIKSVEPGELLEINLKSIQIVSRKVSTPHSLLSPPGRKISEILQNSILQRTAGHKSFALSMSGGIDSTIIAIEAVKLGLSFEAYSVRWKDSDKPRYNQDFNAARLICKQLGIKLNTVDMPGVKFLSKEINEYVKAISDPNSNPSGISMMTLYNQIAKSGTRLVLTGDGSDEIFGGYSRYEILNRFNRLPQISSNRIFNFVLMNSSNFGNLSKIAAVSSSALNPVAWYYWHQLADNNYLRNFYHDFSFQKIKIQENLFEHRVFEQKNRVAGLMYRDLKVWLAMESNTKLDSVSMYHSIEARSPFQSENLISEAFHQMSKFNHRLINKKILVDSYPELDTLPVNKIKLGFMSPLGHWLRNNTDLVNESVGYLGKHFAFNSQELKRLKQSPGKNNYMDFRFLWSLIILAHWWQQQ